MTTRRKRPARLTQIEVGTVRPVDTDEGPGHVRILFHRADGTTRSYLFDPDDMARCAKRLLAACEAREENLSIAFQLDTGVETFEYDPSEAAECASLARRIYNAARHARREPIETAWIDALPRESA